MAKQYLYSFLMTHSQKTITIYFFLLLPFTDYYSYIILYADDLQLYSQARVEDISQAIDNIKWDLEFIKSWSMRFGPSSLLNAKQF